MVVRPGRKTFVTIHSHIAYMRTRRALRHSSPAPYGAKTAYVGDVTDSSQMEHDKRLHASKLASRLVMFHPTMNNNKGFTNAAPDP